MAEQASPRTAGGTVVREAARSRRILVAREVMLITSGVILYFVVRGLIDGRVAIAYRNADHLVGFERWAGLFVEPQLQAATTDHPWLVETLNAIYIYGHWPVVVLTLAWLLLRHRDDYARFRNGILISGAIGLLIFATFPVAPPRFLPEFGFIDTVTENSSAYRVLQPPAFVNQYAAVPSLHFGWNLLIGIAWAYPGAGHGFMNDHDPADATLLLRFLARISGTKYDAGATLDARRRIAAFFDAHLRGSHG